MFTKPLHTIVFFLSVLFLLGAAMPNQWDVAINPDPPTSGDTVTVDVDEAPGSSVTVRFRINGTTQSTQTIETIPGSLTFNVPAGTSGKSFEFEFSSAGATKSIDGTIN